MKICYLGAAWMEKLNESFDFDMPLPVLKRRYPFGTNLAIGLSRLGHHVSIVTLSMAVAETVEAHSRDCDVYVVPERRVRWQYPTFYRKELNLLHDVISRIRPDVVVANWTYQYARAGVTSGYPCLVIARDSPWRCLWQMRLFSFLYKTLYSQFFVFPHIRHMSTISPHMVEDLRRFNRYKGDVAVIPNGIAGGGAGEKKHRATATTIVCVSEWNRLKNSKTLFRAFEILRKKHGDWRLLVVGNCMDDACAGMWMRRAGISSEGVTLLGRKTQAEIKGLLQDDADVFCSPTLEESFGQVFLEAMAQGVPCVGGEKSGAVSWVMGDGGVTCDVTSPKKLAACLERVMLDLSLRKRLGENGAKRARTAFDMDTVIRQYERTLAEVATCK